MFSRAVEELLQDAGAVEEMEGLKRLLEFSTKTWFLSDKPVSIEHFIRAKEREERLLERSKLKRKPISHFQSQMPSLKATREGN